MPNPASRRSRSGLRTDAPPLSDARVREAIDIALDRDALIRDIAPGGGAVTGPVNPHLAGGYWSLPETEVRAAFGGAEQDDARIARAKALLAAAGAPDAQLALQTVDSPRMIDLATAIREQLLQIGIDLRIDELDPLTWFANFRTGRFQITLISHEPYESTDMPTRFFHSGGVDANGNMFALHDRGNRCASRAFVGRGRSRGTSHDATRGTAADARIAGNAAALYERRLQRNLG